MADDQSATTSGATWMSDVQRALALLIIGLLVLAAAALVARVTISAAADDVLDITKIMLAMLGNMGLIALGFFFGNTIAKQQNDRAQSALVEKLTPPASPPPVAPAAATVAPWWGKMTDAEKSAVTAWVPNDPRVAAIVTAMQAGAATPDDLAYLVNKGLLTQDRANVIQAA